MSQTTSARKRTATIKKSMIPERMLTGLSTYSPVLVISTQTITARKTKARIKKRPASVKKTTSTMKITGKIKHQKTPDYHKVTAIIKGRYLRALLATVVRHSNTAVTKKP